MFEKILTRIPDRSEIDSLDEQESDAQTSLESNEVNIFHRHDFRNAKRCLLVAVNGFSRRTAVLGLWRRDPRSCVR